MKTLIFNGSPRKNGDTAALIGLLVRDLPGEYFIVDAHCDDIAPCNDCRFCQKNDYCVIDDHMREVYAYIQECDNIVIASPIYFSELPGRLLDVGSRLQRYFCARFFRHEVPIRKSKKGAVILVGGGDGNMEKAYDTACTLLRHMNCRDILDPVFSHDTNKRPAAEDEAAVSGLKDIVSFFDQEA